MGHERVGFLPRTKKWAAVVQQMAAADSIDFSVSEIAAQTLENVRHRYEILFRDDAVKSAFRFLVIFSHACRFPDTRNHLNDVGIPISEQVTLLSVVKALRAYVPTREGASEYGQLALSSAADAIVQWHKQNTTTQIPLFQPSPDFFDSLRGLGSGGGFCELSRLYFGKLTERYLNYFLDRAASATLSTIQQREKFRSDIQSHIEDVSRHAFETAQITQSFAAGWFTRHTRQGVPSTEEIEGFLAIAFGKLRDELRREEGAR